MAGLLIFQAKHLSLTVDEPTHLLSAYLYWNGRDRLPPADMPPLIKLAGGWTIRSLALPVPANLGHWGDTRHEWIESVNMISSATHPVLADLAFRARLPLIVFPLLTAVILWRWGRALFSPYTGLLMAALFAFEPTALGHGAIFKNDHAAAFAFLLFWFTAWRHWRRPPVSFAALMGGVAALAVLSKFSLLILLPVAVVVVAARCVTENPRTWRRLALAQFTLLTAAYLLILAVYQLDTRRLQESDLAVLDATTAPLPVKAAARVFLVLPAATNMWKGVVALFQDASHVKHIYLMGALREDGHRLYFAAATAVKASLGVLILFEAGLVLMWRMPGIAPLALAPLLLYAGAASMANLQLGLRLILPALPFAILICGAAIHAWNRTRYRFAGPVCALVLAVESASIYPYGISFFNVLAGGPAQGLKYLSGSNLDWGQSLPALAETLDRNKWHGVKLFYFGGDTPFRFVSYSQIQFMAPPWSPELAQGERLEPEPGYYAISAAMLSGQLFDVRYRDYFDAFRRLEPVERAGHSIYIYRIAPQVSGR